MASLANELVIDFEKGGLIGRRNVNNLAPYMFTELRNIVLGAGGLRKRKGSILLTTRNTPPVIGIKDFILSSGAQNQVIVNQAGEIYTRQDTGTLIKTSWNVNEIPAFETFRDKLYICCSNDDVQVWTGTGTTDDIASPAVEWTGSNHPRQIVRHGRINSQRLWACGVPSVPYLIFASELNTDNFGADVVRNIPIDTEDNSGIVGMTEFGDRLVCFSNNHSFIIDDSSLNLDDWGYQESQWLGGAAHHKLIIRTPNDIVCMMENGEIYSFTTAQQYGDYKAGSLTRASYMHEWISDYVDLSEISTFHGLYHPKRKAVMIWVKRKGNATIDTALIFYVDRPVAMAWAIEDALDGTDSGYNAASAAIVRNAVGDQRVFTGSSLTEKVYRLSEAGISDNGNAYTGKARLAIIDCGEPKKAKRFLRLRLIGETQGNNNITIDWTVDDVAQSSKTISMLGSGGFILDVSQLDIDSFGPDFEMFDEKVDLYRVGNRLELTISNNDDLVDFFIQKAILEYEVLA